jgi:16S rRNA (uracil1498-N3)-methyltransferase
MSSIPRLFVDADLGADLVFELSDGQSRYLSRVMRLAVGDAARVFNGRQGEWLCAIDRVQSKRVALRAKQQLRPQPNRSGPAITLLFAPLKKSQTDYAVEKATELGVRNICPVLTEWTQTRTVRVDRLEKIAAEAAEQTERLDVPKVAELARLETALDALPSETVIIYCDEAMPGSGEAEPILAKLQTLQGQSAALLIGPEGGFSDAERTSLRSRTGVHAVSLGPRILRAETAIAAALALWQAVCGDWE